jgi:hypothetical protein
MNVPQALKAFWTHPMKLLDDVGHVESHFSPFGDTGSVGGRYVHGLRQTCNKLRNLFGRTRWYS